MKPRTALALFGVLLTLSGCTERRQAEPASKGPLSPQAVLARLPAAEPFELTEMQASRFVALSLDCTERPWPNKPSHVYHDEQEVAAPRRVTPAFYGCFDWHSAVHGHWAMLRLLKTFDRLPEAERIRQRLDAHLSPAHLQQELAFFQLERSATFERPYGWGWYMRLYAELYTSDEPNAKRWRQAAAPLARHFSDAMRDYLDRLSVPVREGTHSNTAFALVHMLDAARVTGDTQLAAAIERAARNFYLEDRDCPTDYEPSGEDFISPCLTEADLMGRMLSEKAFAAWLERFVPPPGSERFQPLLTPIQIKDRKDPRIGHLIGLAFQRAWCFLGIANRLPADNPQRALFERLAAIHRQAGLEQMFDSGYGGSHWLASFAIYLLTGVGLDD